MNFLTHALPYLDRPLLAVSTGVPDLMRVADRRIRVRARAARPFVDSEDAAMRAVARGVIQHVEDDRWFHGTAAFVELNLQLAVQLRDQLPGDAGFRPSFVGHILIEMLLDAFWIRDDRSTGDHYYRAFGSTDPSELQSCVNRITGVPTTRLTEVIERFVAARFLFDYLDDDRLLWRLNQIMNRVGLAALPPSLTGWLPQARELVESRRRELLASPEPTEWHVDLP